MTPVTGEFTAPVNSHHLFKSLTVSPVRIITIDDPRLTLLNIQRIRLSGELQWDFDIHMAQ